MTDERVNMNDFQVEYDDSTEDFTILWPNGSFLVAMRDGSLVGKSNDQLFKTSLSKISKEQS